MDERKDFPRHKAGLFLTHNEHKGYYEALAHWADDNLEEDDWVCEEEKILALAVDEVWVLQWYPNTPIGFCKLAGYNLSAVLEAARNVV